MTRPTDRQIAAELLVILEAEESLARSREYVDGRAAAVRQHGARATAEWIHCPYTPASAQADAWMAGYTAGREAVAARWTDALIRLMCDEVWS